MNTLVLENFKAFLSPVTFDFDGKNALIYGENGSGKSSVYHALKLWFYTSRLYADPGNIDRTLTDPADIANARSDFQDSHNHQKNKTTRFSITLNGTAYSDTATPPAGYDVAMVERSDLEIADSINIAETVGNAFTNISDPAKFISDNKEVLELYLNDAIQKHFHEPDISVSFHPNGSEWLLKITDSARSLERTSGLHRYFNEGKLHLIKLLLLLTCIESDRILGVKKILVLDDVITSLDATYRTFLIEYLHATFNEYQVIILTHSITYFNQLHHAFTIAYGESDKWKSFHIVEYQGESGVIDESALITASKLRKIYSNGMRPGRSLPTSLPTDIRKRFEYLVTELSGILAIGGVSECGKMLSAINNTANAYYRYDSTAKRTLSIHDMVSEMIAEITSATASPLKTTLETIITNYSNNPNIDSLQNILKQLTIYQKVTMHAGSHHTGALAPVTAPEMDACITLLREMERLMNSLISRDVYSF